MTRKWYSEFRKTPGLGPHHQMHLRVLSRTLIRDAVGLFYNINQLDWRVRICVCVYIYIYIYIYIHVSVCLYVCQCVRVCVGILFVIVQGFRTIVFIFIVIFTTFRPIYFPAFFRCYLSNLVAYTELRTTSFYNPLGSLALILLTIIGYKYSCIVTRLQPGVNLQPPRRMSVRKPTLITITSCVK